MYDFYLDRAKLPVTPAKLNVKITGKNQRVNLINEGEINVLKKAGLTEISFTALLPNAKYPFSQSDNAGEFLEVLERLKTQTDANGKFLPFQFIVSRVLPNGKVLFDTNVKVALEDYKIDEDAKNGLDISVDIQLRQYKNYGTKTVEIKAPTAVSPQITAAIEPQRPAENPPNKQTHTVVKGDCLWAIAQKYLGNGNRYQEIYELNKSVIDAGNRGTGNVKYTIYPGQVFVMPFVKN